MVGAGVKVFMKKSKGLKNSAAETRIERGGGFYRLSPVVQER